MIPVNRPEFGIKDFISVITRNKDSISILEQMFAQYIGLDYSVFTSSGKSALYLGYKSLNLEGEVIASPLTCSDAVLPMVCCNLKPCFVDIDPQTYNIDPEKIDEAIARNTCAIQIIHLAGNPCDMKPIEDLAEDYDLILIEDCAQSLGAEYQKKMTGSFGKLSCFSLMKNMYGIGGGMIATNDHDISLNVRDFQQKFSKLAQPIKYYRLFKGYIEKCRGQFLGDLIADMLYHFRVNMRLDDRNDCNIIKNIRLFNNPTNIEASVSLSQFNALDKYLERRMDNASLLTRELKKYPGLKIQKITENSKPVFTKYMIETEYPSVDIITKLRNRGIEAMHLRQPCRALYQERFDKDPFYSRFESIKKCENYLKIHNHVVSLPISSNMSNTEIMYLAKHVGQYLNEKLDRNPLKKRKKYENLV